MSAGAEPSSSSSVDDPEEATQSYLLQHNAKLKPFAWTKTTEGILSREHGALHHISGNW